MLNLFQMLPRPDQFNLSATCKWLYNKRKEYDTIFSYPIILTRLVLDELPPYFAEERRKSLIFCPYEGTTELLREVIQKKKQFFNSIEKLRVNRSIDLEKLSLITTPSQSSLRQLIIENYTSQSLPTMPELSALDITFDKKTNLSVEFWLNAFHLERLTLNHQHTDSLALPENFEEPSSLVKLKIVSPFLTALPENFGLYFPTLQELVLDLVTSKQRLKVNLAAILPVLNQLSILEISSESLAVLPKEFWSSISNLKKLALRLPNLPEVLENNERVHPNLTDLSVWYLRNPANFEWAFPNLQTLALIAIYALDSFPKLEHLTYLVIAPAQEINLPRNFWSNIPKIKKLMLHNINFPLSTISAPLNSLSELLIRNPYSNSRIPFPEELWSNMPKLQKLILELYEQSQKITVESSKVLKQLIDLEIKLDNASSFDRFRSSIPYVQHLNLSLHEVKSLPEDFAPLPLKNLVKLEFYAYDLTTLSDGFWTTIPNIQELDLTLNKLVALSISKNLITLSQLTDFKLTSGSLSKLPENFGEFFPNLRKLTLVLDSIKTLPINLATLSQLTELECTFPILTELPENFGVSFPLLRELKLLLNRLIRLPKKFATLNYLTRLEITAPERARVSAPKNLSESYPRLQYYRLCSPGFDEEMEIDIEEMLMKMQMEEEETVELEIVEEMEEPEEIDE